MGKVCFNLLWYLSKQYFNNTHYSQKKIRYVLLSKPSYMSAHALIAGLWSLQQAANLTAVRTNNRPIPCL